MVNLLSHGTNLGYPQIKDTLLSLLTHQQNQILMPLAKPLPDLRQDLREMLVEDLAATLLALKELLPEGSEKHNTVLSLRGQLKDANKERARNTITPDDYQRRIDTIRAQCLDMIDGLEPADFEQTTKGDKAGKSAARQGSVLYRVPHKMRLKKPAICTIRVAMDEDAILEDIVLDEDVRLKSKVEVSDMMKAELLDPAGEVFSIRPLSEAEQLVREQGYTQWLFSVTPNTEGEHQLLIKVSMMEYNAQLDRYVPREVSVLETVTIVTETTAPADTEDSPLKATGERFVMGPDAVPPVSAADASPAPQSTARTAYGRGLRFTAMFLVLLLAGSSATWALTPTHTRDWWVTSWRDNAEAYAAYIEKHSDNAAAQEQVEKAYFKKADKTEELADLRQYQEKYPTGTFQQQVLKQIDRLEVKALEQLRQQVEVEQIKQFIADFPDSKRLDEVMQIATKKPQVKQLVQAQLEAAIEQQQTKTPPVEDTKNDSQSSSNQSLPAPSSQPDSTTTTTQKPVEDNPVNLPNSQKTTSSPDIEMVLVKGGTFTMGCTIEQQNCEDDEKPAHQVTVNDFYIGKYEVTQKQWRSVMGSDPPKLYNKGCDECPVERVSWNDVQAFIKKLNQQSGRQYRLPTEAEWEYAARGGNQSRKYQYAGSNNIDEVAWHDNNAEVSNTFGEQKTTRPAGTKSPNELGLYDMSGNVWEWCSDWHGEDYYKNSPSTNPKGPASGSYRVLRGGSWNFYPQNCRVAYRLHNSPGYRNFSNGFRLARTK